MIEGLSKTIMNWVESVLEHTVEVMEESGRYSDFTITTYRSHNRRVIATLNDWIWYRQPHTAHAPTREQTRNTPL